VIVGAVVVVGLVVVYVMKGSKKGGTIALDAKEYRKFTLEKKTDVSPNTTIFTFKLPDPKMRFGLPVGSHCLFRCEGKDGKPVSRPYTPVSSDDELGFFDMLVKVYSDGKMGQHLKALPVGGQIEVRGPLGDIRYEGLGKFAIQRKTPAGKQTQRLTVKRVAMIAGGSGITPMLQIVRDVCKNQQDRTELSLIFANVTEADILLRAELDKLASEHKNFKVHYTLDKPHAGWSGSTGFVTAEMMQKHLPGPADDSVLLMCGPPRMIESLEKNCKSLDYRDDQFFKY